MSILGTELGEGVQKCIMDYWVSQGFRAEKFCETGNILTHEISDTITWWAHLKNKYKMI